MPTNFNFPSVPTFIPNLVKKEPLREVFHIPSITPHSQNKLESQTEFNHLKLEISEIDKKLEASNSIINDLEGGKQAAKLPLIATLIKTFYSWYNQTSLTHERLQTNNLDKIAKIYTNKIEILRSKIERINDQEKVSLHVLMKAINKDDYEAIQSFILRDPEGFKTLLLKQNGFGDTPVLRTVEKERVEILKLMAQVAPKEFRTALTIPNQFEWTPLSLGILRNIKMLKLMSEEAPDQFKEMVLTENSYGTHLSIALENNILALKLMSEKAPDQFKEMLLKEKDYGTLISLAFLKKKTEALELFSVVANQEYRLALKMKNKGGNSPIDLAVNDLEFMNLFFDRSLDECQSWLNSADENGQTPVYKAALKKNLPLLKLMAEKAPKEFKVALLRQDKVGNTPLHVSACSSFFNLEVTKFLIDKSPLEALNAINNEGDTIFTLIKQFRPKDYKEITQLLKIHVSLKQLHKVQVNRKGLGHVFDISGKTDIIKTDTKEVIATNALTGHQPYEWYHLAEKYFDELVGLYPQLLNENHKVLLKEIFDWGSNGMAYFAEEKLERIKAGLPTLLITGFSTHCVVLLVWGDQLILCNRGGGSRKPIEVYHFNPFELNVETVSKIEKIATHGNLDEYKSLFFEELPKKLHFTQTALDLYLEKSVKLPFQEVDNCSFVSLATGVLAFLLLGNVREESKNNSNAVKSDHKLSFYDESIVRAMASYQTWLVHLQLSFLERNICGSKEKSPFEPDCKLVEAALRKAHLMPLDSISKKKLDELTSIYNMPILDI